MTGKDYHTPAIIASREKRAGQLREEARVRKECIQAYIVKLVGTEVHDSYFSLHNKDLWKHWGFVPWKVRDRLARLGEL